MNSLLLIIVQYYYLFLRIEKKIRNFGVDIAFAANIPISDREVLKENVIDERINFGGKKVCPSQDEELVDDDTDDFVLTKDNKLTP